MSLLHTLCCTARLSLDIGEADVLTIARDGAMIAWCVEGGARAPARAALWCAVLWPSAGVARASGRDDGALGLLERTILRTVRTTSRERVRRMRAAKTTYSIASTLCGKDYDTDTLDLADLAKHDAIDDASFCREDAAYSPEQSAPAPALIQRLLDDASRSPGPFEKARTTNARARRSPSLTSRASPPNAAPRTHPAHSPPFTRSSEATALRRWCRLRRRLAHAALDAPRGAHPLGRMGTRLPEPHGHEHGRVQQVRARRRAAR